MRLYIGIDGGQSSTTALIAEESGRIVGRGTGGPCNHVSGPEAREKFFSAVGQCLEQACALAGIESSNARFAAACLGFSGGAADKESFAKELIRAESYKITHDAEIALAGATAGRPGIIVIAGTGSMAFGRNDKGVVARAGGWGYIFGDEGGGFDLTRAALRAALQQEEGWGPATKLSELLLKETGSPDANHLLHRFYTLEYSRAEIARLSKLVSEAADQGDEVALGIVGKAATQLAILAEAVFQQLFSRGQSIPIAHVGGVFQNKRLTEQFVTALHDRTGCFAGPPRFSPAAGAVLEAMRLDNNQNELSSVPAFDK